MTVLRRDPKTTVLHFEATSDDSERCRTADGVAREEHAGRVYPWIPLAIGLFSLVLVNGRLNKLPIPHALVGRVIYEALDPESLADLAIAVRYDSAGYLRGSPVGIGEEILPAFADESLLWA